jgi:hypothetical protein
VHPTELRLACAVVCVFGCGRAEPSGPATTAAPATALAAPRTTFEIIDDFPRKPGTPAPQPPEAALKPWQVWVNQERPRQKRNPRWNAHDAKASVDLELEPGTSFRCLLNPVRLSARSEETGEVEAWSVWRSVRCSSDGWTTHVEAQLTIEVTGDGTWPERIEPAPLFLRETVDGKPREISIALRPLREPKSVAPQGSAEPGMPSDPAGSL